VKTRVAALDYGCRAGEGIILKVKVTAMERNLIILAQIQTPQNKDFEL
jgi:hypothetical protein